MKAAVKAGGAPCATCVPPAHRLYGRVASYAMAWTLVDLRCSRRRRLRNARFGYLRALGTLFANGTILVQASRWRYFPLSRSPNTH